MPPRRIALGTSLGKIGWGFTCWFAAWGTMSGKKLNQA